MKLSRVKKVNKGLFDLVSLIFLSPRICTISTRRNFYNHLLGRQFVGFQHFDLAPWSTVIRVNLEVAFECESSSRGKGQCSLDSLDDEPAENGEKLVCMTTSSGRKIQTGVLWMFVDQPIPVRSI